MKITIESTSKIVQVNGIDCRLWEGFTEGGVAVVALIPRVACSESADTAEFERDLNDPPPPEPGSGVGHAFPIRMAL